MSAVSVSQFHQNSWNIYSTYTTTKANFYAVSDEHRIHFRQETYITDKQAIAYWMNTTEQNGKTWQ
jgi:hypothetical protein